MHYTQQGSALGVRDSASYKRGAKAKRWSKLSVLRLGNNKVCRYHIMSQEIYDKKLQ